VPTPPPAPKAPDFDWRDDPDIVIPSQDAIACYYNDRGAIVIRQQAGFYDSEDHVIIVRPEYIVPLISKLQRLERGEE
jgi:hypothetical protein